MTSPLSVVPRFDAVTIRLEGQRILMLRDGKVILDMPAEKAEVVARALIAKARLAEEMRKADAIALDQALLLRKGIPLSLTSHPKIQAEAAKEAAWNRDLRRFLPGGVKSAGAIRDAGRHPARPAEEGTAMNPEDMSIEALNDHIRERSNSIDAAKEELRAICRVRDAKAAAKELEKVVAGLSPAARAQVISRAGGIESAERVGTPGR